MQYCNCGGTGTQTPPIIKVLRRPFLLCFIWRFTRFIRLLYKTRRRLARDEQRDWKVERKKRKETKLETRNTNWNGHEGSRKRAWNQIKPCKMWGGILCEMSRDSSLNFWSAKRLIWIRQFVLWFSANFRRNIRKPPLYAKSIPNLLSE